jgi:hypothetical protein
VILGSLPSGIRRWWIVFLGYLNPLSLASLVRSFFGNQVRARFARLFRKVNPYDVHDTIPSPGIPFTLPGDLRGSRGSHALFQACTRVGFDDHGFASVDSCVAPIAGLEGRRGYGETVHGRTIIEWTPRNTGGAYRDRLSTVYGADFPNLGSDTPGHPIRGRDRSGHTSTDDCEVDTTRIQGQAQILHENRGENNQPFLLTRYAPSYALLDLVDPRWLEPMEGASYLEPGGKNGASREVVSNAKDGGDNGQS